MHVPALMPNRAPSQCHEAARALLEADPFIDKLP